MPQKAPTLAQVTKLYAATMADGFARTCRRVGLPEPIREHRFDPSRRWRFDYAWPHALIAVEQEGGIWTRGRHTRGKGALNDMEKYNRAQILGWIVLRYSPQQIQAGVPIETLKELLYERLCV